MFLSPFSLWRWHCFQWASFWLYILEKIVKLVASRTIVIFMMELSVASVNGFQSLTYFTKNCLLVAAGVLIAPKTFSIFSSISKKISCILKALQKPHWNFESIFPKDAESCLHIFFWKNIGDNRYNTHIFKVILFTLWSRLQRLT